MTSLKEKWLGAKASAQGMSLDEFKSYKKELNELERKEKLAYKKDMIIKKYQDKRTGTHKGLNFESLLNTASKMGSNVLKNIPETKQQKTSVLKEEWTKPKEKKVDWNEVF